MVLPTRTFVLPLRIASSKSPDMPMLSSKVCTSTPSPPATASRHALSLSKHSMSPGAPMVMSPFISSAGQLSLRCRASDKHESRSEWWIPALESSPLVSICRKTPNGSSRPVDEHAVYREGRVEVEVEYRYAEYENTTKHEFQDIITKKNIPKGMANSRVYTPE